MRILLDPGIYDLRNKGNISMLQSAVKGFRSLWPDATIGVVTRGPNVLKYYCPEAHPVSLDDTSEWTRNNHSILDRIVPRSFWRIMFEAREFVRYLRYKSHTSRNYSGTRAPVLENGRNQDCNQTRGENCEDGKQKAITNWDVVKNINLVVASGAGIMCDHAKGHAFSVLDRLEAAIRSHVPTVMVGQLIGPIQDPELLTKVKSVFSGVDIIAIRERRTSIPLLKSLGVANDRIVVTGDDAIELAYKSRSTRPGVGIGVSLRVQSYMEIEAIHLQIIRKVLHQTAATFNAPLISLPISYSFHEEDARVNRQLLQGYRKVIRIGYSRFADPLQVIRNTGNCRLVVTGLYHAAVFALAQGIPVVGLAKSELYKDKLLGLADEFGLGRQVIFLDQEQLQERLTAAIETNWESAAELRPQLLDAAVRQIESRHAAYQQIYDLVESRSRQLCIVGEVR
jgi:polysaccharide pyruvyl transferase WcaK-like protein